MERKLELLTIEYVCMEFSLASTLRNPQRGTMRSFEIPVEQSSSLGDLKKLVCQKLNRPPGQLLLSQGLKQLDDEGDDGKNLGSMLTPSGPSVHATDYSELRRGQGPGAPVCRIAQTEHRGITLRQLKSLLCFFRARTGADGNIAGWYDRAQQSPTYGQRLALETLNLYQVTDWLIKPATRAHRCSLVEFIARAPAEQRPRWFTSHFWGEPVACFISCVEGHAGVRELGAAESYWVCAYANNQHELGQDLTRDPYQTSFYRAMRNSVGVLLILDSSATPFSRIWCSFEESVALTDMDRPTGEKMKLDIATHISTGPVVLTDGLTSAEAELDDFRPGVGWEWKARREAPFPMGLVHKAMDIDVEKSMASQPIDRVRILNAIAKRPDRELDDTPPKGHPMYGVVNRGLRAIFAAAAWPNCMGRGHDAMRRELSAALRADSTMSYLCLSFAGQKHAVHDGILEELRGLYPDLLRELVLDFSKCDGISDGGVQNLSKGLPRNLVTLELQFRTCSQIGDAGLDELVRGMPGTLRNLYLCYTNAPKGTTRISEDGLSLFFCNLPQGLENLGIDFGGMDIVSDRVVTALARGLPGRLLQLDLFCRGLRFGDAGLEVLAASLPRGLSKFSLNISSCRSLTPRGFMCLAEGLPKCSTELRIRCKKFPGGLTNHCVGRLAEHLPAYLTRLELACDDCCGVGDMGVASLARHLPLWLSTLELDLSYCHSITDAGLLKLAAYLPAGLLTLRMDLKGCRQISDAGLVSLAEHLPKQLLNLDLDFEACCDISNAGAAVLAQRLPPTLRVLKLCLKDFKRIDDTIVDAVSFYLPRDMEQMQLILMCTGVTFAPSQYNSLSFMRYLQKLQRVIGAHRALEGAPGQAGGAAPSLLALRQGVTDLARYHWRALAHAPDSLRADGGLLLDVVRAHDRLSRTGSPGAIGDPVEALQLFRLAAPEVLADFVQFLAASGQGQVAALLGRFAAQERPPAGGYVDSYGHRWHVVGAGKVVLNSQVEFSLEEEGGTTCLRSDLVPSRKYRLLDRGRLGRYWWVGPPGQGCHFWTSCDLDRFRGDLFSRLREWGGPPTGSRGAPDAVPRDAQAILQGVEGGDDEDGEHDVGAGVPGVPEWRDLYFEVISGSDGFVDPRGRGFPYSLGPFNLQPTAAFTAATLRTEWHLSETGERTMSWELGRDAFHTPSLRQLVEGVPAWPIRSRTTPVHAVTLPATERALANIPEEAAHYAFSYSTQSVDWSAEPQQAINSSDPDVAFLLFGAFMYFGADFQLVRTNALFFSGKGLLQFGPPKPWRPEWTATWREKDRLIPLANKYLRSFGPTHICWLTPGELEGLPHGAFAYIRVADGEGGRRSSLPEACA